MFIRVVAVKAKNRTYQYTQIVESYRRESDGRSAHRVVTNLGELPPLLTENLRRAFAAARQRQSVVVPVETGALPGVKPVASLAWLDVAVLLHLWRTLGLDTLFSELLPKGEQTVPPADVVAALAIHRCVDPDSKFAATTWFGRTALPELLGVAPGQFSNTRVHRVLSALDAATAELHADLPNRLAGRGGPISAMYLDLTDTWFVGRGPEKAEERRTKEGLWRRKIGILLLCDPHGRPLRWSVLPGRTHDAAAMIEVARALKGSGWATGLPLVCDRIMGVPARLAQLDQAGFQFVTALSNITLAGQLSDQLPKIDVEGIDLDAEDAETLLGARAAVAGLSALRARSFARDLGVTTLRIRDERRNKRVSDHAAALHRARTYQAARRDGLPRSKALVAAGVALGSLPRLLKLLKMHADVVAAIERGDADGLSFETLQRLAGRPVSEQPAALEAARGHARKRNRHAIPAPDDDAEEDPALPESVQARLILCFHPAFFLRQRRGALQGWNSARAFIDDLNERLASPSSRRTEGSIIREVGRMLYRHSVADVSQVHIGKIDTVDGQRYHVSLAQDPTAWDRHRALDGFRVLAAHPNLMRTPEQIAQMYSDKQAVELDFRTIKSSLELRPVFHRNDPKVSAHVTLCMLALLLLRELERLAPDIPSAPALLDRLQTTHLVKLRLAPTSHSYALTEPTPDLKDTLRQLGAEHLLDDTWAAQHITPR